MASIRCSNCNLVNFGTETQCKRCKQPLQELLNIADERQADFNQNPQNSTSTFHSYQMPTTPPVFYEDQRQPEMPRMCCIKCNKQNNISMQNFKKDYVPPILYITFFLGILPGLLLIALLKVKHNVSAPFCQECWKNFRRIPGKDVLGLFGIIGGFFIGIFALVIFESVFLMLLIFAGGIGLMIHSQVFKSKHSPKYKKVTRKEVIITDPIYGDICFAR